MTKDKKNDKSSSGAVEPPRSSSPPPRKKKTGAIVKLVLWALLMTAAAGGLGYLAYDFWQRNKTLDETLVKSQGGLDNCQTSLEGAENRLATINQEFATCQSEKKQLEAVKEDMERLQSDLKASAEELESLRKQRQQVEKRLEAFRNLTEKLKSMIDSGQLDVAVRNGRMLVELPAEVMFPSGSAELSEDGEMALMRVAISLEQFPDRQFMIAGHSDNLPLTKSKYSSNWELSTARAVTVTEFLVKAGMDPKNLIAAGYGQHHPVASNKNAKGRQKNRRIEIVLMPSIEELPDFPELEEEGDDEEKPD